MQYGICATGQAPIRPCRKEASELVTQMLFGETCKIVDQKSSWYFVYTDTDQYLGWVDIEAVKLIPHETYQQILQKEHPRLTSAWGTIAIDNQHVLISQASTLPFFENGAGHIDDTPYELKSGSTKPVMQIAAPAKDLLGAPYLWGGRTAIGIDCSALVFNIFKLAGYLLPRDASEQVNHGQTIAFLGEANYGDICFFDNEEGNIVHTGVLLSNNQIIHASGSVRIDSIDHQGIYNREIEKYTHHLRIIKRIELKTSQKKQSSQ